MEKMTVEHYAVALLGVAFMANVIANQVYGYPFVYCVTREYAWLLYANYGPMVLVLVMLGIPIAIYRKDWMAMLGLVSLFAGINNLPLLAAMVLKQGGSCV